MFNVRVAKINRRVLCLLVIVCLCWMRRRREGSWRGASKYTFLTALKSLGDRMDLTGRQYRLHCHCATIERTMHLGVGGVTKLACKVCYITLRPAELDAVYSMVLVTRPLQYIRKCLPACIRTQLHGGSRLAQVAATEGDNNTGQQWGRAGNCCGATNEGSHTPDRMCSLAAGRCTAQYPLI